MESRRPIITLTTDFGMADGTLGAVIGVIKSICPEAEVVSATATVPAHDVVRGAWALYQSVPFFPRGTIHVAVVDPGVGSGRRAILVQTGREILIGPDNGVFSWAWRGRAEVRFRTLSNQAYRLSEVGVTFDGRDLFAPVAAHIARGVDAAVMGPEITHPCRLDWPDPVRTADRIEGCILVEDAFGNLITNIPFEMAAAVFAETALKIELDGRAVGRLCRSYEDITQETGAVVNGVGLLEIAGRRRSAADLTGARRGARVVVTAEGDDR